MEMEMVTKPVLLDRNQFEMDRKRKLEEEDEDEGTGTKKMAKDTDQIKEEHAYSSRSGAAGRGCGVTEKVPDEDMKEEDSDKENDWNYWKKNEKSMAIESFGGIGEVGCGELKEKHESALTTDGDAECMDRDQTIETGCKASSKAVLNAVVMSRVAKWMPTTDLVQLRETCTLWNKSMVPTLRRRHIPANLTFKWPVTVCKTGLCANTRRLLDTLANAVDIPLGSLNISMFMKPTKSIMDDFRLNLDHSRLLSRSRWGECLNTLAIVSTRTGPINPRQDVTLDVTGLRNFIFNDTPMLRKLSMSFGSHGCKEREAQPFQLGQKLSQLKKLEIGGEFRPNVKNLISDICTAATRLEALNIHDVDGGLFAFQYMRDNPRHLPQLQRLKLDFGATIKTQIHLAKLIKLSKRDTNTLRLAKIKTSICIVGKESRQSTADLFVKFLGLQSNGLRKLKIEFTSSDNSQQYPSAVTGLTMPDMDALEVLDIKMPKEKVTHVHMGHYPNLRIVRHDFHNLPTATRDEHMAALSRSPVTEMSQQKFQSIVAMHIFADSFANLKKLSLRLSSVQLELVWTRWPLLEFLEIWLTDKGRALTSKKTMDTILTGIDFLTPAFRESSQIIWEETAGLTRLTQTQDDFRVPRFTKQSPGITDLKFLRVFKMSYHRVKKRTTTEANLATVVVEAGNNLLAQVTDLSGYLAFAAPAAPDSKLQEIRITGGGCNISKKCEETIREAMGPLGVIEFN